MQISNANSDVHFSVKKFITAYGPKLTVDMIFTGPGRTKQAHKAECDINNILARYRKTGVLDFTQKHEPQYGDVTALEYQSAQLLIAGAKSMFAELPAHVRNRFDNEPAQFLAFVNDERNREEAEKLGLLKPKAAEPEAPAPDQPKGKKVKPEAPQGAAGESGAGKAIPSSPPA